MSSESPVLMNPKGNNKLLLVTAIGQSGREIRLALLKPGQSYRPEKTAWSVRELPRPVTLDAQQTSEGVFEAF